MWVAPISKFSAGGMFSNTLTNIRVANNYIANFYNYGILLGLCSNSEVSNNVLEDFTRNGIVIAYNIFTGEGSCDNNLVRGNVVRFTRPDDGFAHEGIAIWVGSNNTITQNTIENAVYPSNAGYPDYAGTYGIDLFFTSNCTVSQNAIKSLGQPLSFGLYLEVEPSFNNVYGNDFSNSTATFAQVYAEGNGNTFMNNNYGPLDLTSIDPNTGLPTAIAGFWIRGNGNTMTNENFLGLYPGVYAIPPTPPVPCVLLEEGTSGNVITALKNGQVLNGSVKCTQIKDLGTNSIPGLESCANMPYGNLQALKARIEAMHAAPQNKRNF